MSNFNSKDTVWSNHGEVSDNLLAVSHSLDNLIQENLTLLMDMFSFFGMYQFFPLHHSNGYILYIGFSTLSENDDKLIKSLDFLVLLDIHHD